MTQNFQNAKIYKITNDYNEDVYVGSTCDSLMKRFSGHKRSYKSETKKNRPVYKLMNEIGFERFRIDLIEDYPCNDKQALRQREGHFIREIATLNVKIEGRTIQKWRDDNIDKIKEKNKEYYLCNIDYFKEHNKEYRQENKEEINKKQNERRQENREEINKRRQENREEMNKKQNERRQDNREEINRKQREYRQLKKSENKNISI